ncbi:aspartate/glutamate racemase family protein [Arthrobacter crystallopoietes]|uniref:aspartate/glutamate racemase family protein n=1 Tax=Crystallibacter crystallopoietes TaxID=37928 RepID=UPI001ABECD32|nr:aspartate/glutamate racemase family protein [Arthrobacter crystallopoietes]QTG81741.1 aspartate/glutamate racemase family protein [Arthrobacter crystallopoietes]
MRILVINPNSNHAMTQNIDRMAKSMAGPDTIISTISPEMAPASIESHAEDIVAGYRLIEAATTHPEPYDALVIACYYDPALEALREVLDVPVIGIAEASAHMASLVAPKFSVVTVLRRGVRHVENVIDAAGLSSRCASVRGVDLGVLDIDADHERAATLIAAEALKAISEDGAEAIALGCAGMGPLDKRLQEELGVPVLDGVACAVPLAESCVKYGITTSKINSYDRPPAKKSPGLDPLLEQIYVPATELKVNA